MNVCIGGDMRRVLIIFSDMWWSNMIKDGVQWYYVNDSDSRSWVMMILIDIWTYVCIFTKNSGTKSVLSLYDNQNHNHKIRTAITDHR